MSTLVITRCRHLAGVLAELKANARVALATELAATVAAAVRDVLVVALVDRLVTPRTPTMPPPASRSPSWGDDEGDRERDRWGDPIDPWYDPDGGGRDRYAPHEPAEVEPVPAVPAAAAVAVGVNVGRWWLAKKGTVPAAVGFGVLATVLGLAGGPVARAVLAVLAAATDVLFAEAALARPDPS